MKCELVKIASKSAGLNYDGSRIEIFEWGIVLCENKHKMSDHINRTARILLR